jgi:hypothetical protein
MTNDSKFCDETVTRRHSAEAEFWVLVADLSIALNAMVDPRTELSFAMARRSCGTCSSKEKCRKALRPRVVTLSDVAAFCPSVDVFVDLLRRQPHDRGGPLALPSMAPELMHRRLLAGHGRQLLQTWRERRERVTTHCAHAREAR